VTRLTRSSPRHQIDYLHIAIIAGA
jgi:hypothetical protein